MMNALRVERDEDRDENEETSKVLLCFEGLPKEKEKERKAQEPLDCVESLDHR